MSARHVHNIKPVKSGEKFAVILLYAGIAKMFRSPRPLLEIKNKYLFEHHLSIIENRFGIYDTDIIAVTGYESNKLMNKLPSFIKKVENENYETTSVTRSIGMGLRVTNAQNIVVIYGDLYFNRNALDFDVDRSTLLLEKTFDGSVGCTVTDGFADILMYGLPTKWAEIAFFCGKELKILKDICWDETKYKLFGFETINLILDKGGSFKCHEDSKVRICDIDNQTQLGIAKELL